MLSLIFLLSGVNEDLEEFFQLEQLKMLDTRKLLLVSFSKWQLNNECCLSVCISNCQSEHFAGGGGREPLAPEFIK